MSDVMKHVHRDTHLQECLAAALHIARKDPTCREVDRTAEHVVFERETAVDPGISHALKIPTVITFSEKWTFHRDGADNLSKFLVQANMTAGVFGLQIGSYYAQADEGVMVQAKVLVMGLDAYPIMKPLFDTYVKHEFTTRRDREGRRILRARAQARRDAASAHQLARNATPSSTSSDTSDEQRAPTAT